MPEDGYKPLTQVEAGGGQVDVQSRTNIEPSIFQRAGRGRGDLGMGAGGGILAGRQLPWRAKGTSRRRCKREAGRGHSTRYLPSGILNPLKRGRRSQAKTLPGQAIPRLQSSAAGDMERHHHDPVSFSKYSHRHDSLIGFTREVSSLQALLFPSPLGLQGAAGEWRGWVFGPRPPAEARSLVLQTFISLLLSPVRAGEWTLARPGRKARERKSLPVIPPNPTR